MEKRTIGENIIYYRKQKGITQKELADTADMTPSNLFKIERGDVTPKADTLKKIMDALQVSPNQIFGVEQYENIHIQIPFTRNFKILRESANLSPEKAAKLLKITEQEVLDMEDGTLIPSTDLLNKICQVFMVNEDFLTENNVYKRKQNEVKLLEKIKKRNNDIDNVLSLYNSDKFEDHDIEDPETGEVITKTFTPEYFAKNYILKELKALSFTDLFEIYKIFLDREISKLSEELHIS